MIYPNFLCEGYGTPYISLDSIQQLSRTSSTSSQQYTRSSTGKRRQIAMKDLSSGTFECIWYKTDSMIERNLDYISQRQILFGYHPRNFASYVNIDSATVVDSPGNTMKINLGVTFLGSPAGHLWDVSDSGLSGGELVTDTMACLDTAAKLSSQNSMRQATLVSSGANLPDGDYRMFARVRDTTQVSNDVRLGVYAGSTSIAYATVTVASYYRLYTTNFTIESDDLDKTIY